MVRYAGETRTGESFLQSSETVEGFRSLRPDHGLTAEVTGAETIINNAAYLKGASHGSQPACEEGARDSQPGRTKEFEEKGNCPGNSFVRECSELIRFYIFSG